MIIDFSTNDLTNIPLPVLQGPDGFKINHALTLANSNNGLLIKPDSCRISLPFTVEKNEDGFYLRSHFSAYRREVVEVIESSRKMEVLFDVGEYYIPIAVCFSVYLETKLWV